LNVKTVHILRLMLLTVLTTYPRIVEISQYIPLPLRMGEGQGGVDNTFGPPPLYPLPRWGGEVYEGTLNVRDKFSDQQCKNLNDLNGPNIISMELLFYLMGPLVPAS